MRIKRLHISINKCIKCDSHEDAVQIGEQYTLLKKCSKIHTYAEYANIFIENALFSPGHYGIFRSHSILEVYIWWENSKKYNVLKYLKGEFKILEL